MSDLQEQLAILRRKIRQIDRKFASVKPALEPVEKPPEDFAPLHHFVDEFMSGEVVETPHGTHFETEKLWARHRRHGSMDISVLSELPADLLGSLSDGTVPDASPMRWAFLDTETTGLATGSGTYAFLVGVGRITPEGFRIRQFFMRDFGEEASLMHALDEHLAQFDVLVTYNGKTYDQPLLETRFRMMRRKPPFERLAHMDLLFGARRLWKLRLESCRLIELENQILGVEREGDLPGEMIPYVYFEYLRTRQAVRLAPIFHHNAIDILTLACLTAIVPLAFRSPEDAPLHHGADWVGLARWLLKAERHEEALALLRRAVDRGLSDDLLFRTLWEIAMIEKRLGREAAALAAFTELASTRNSHRVAALEELAKHYEHRERNHAMALEFTLSALQISDTDALRRRAERLKRRLSRPRPRRLPLSPAP
ncbi:MAG TPA: ribonuclease H-like domain-containing protein [Bryobacteraceae bacterium]|nr:ribonuclease H-like domain-containing protein [Bryobacteraceae bacterium]